MVSANDSEKPSLATSVSLAARQVLLIANLNGWTWLRRYPDSMLFSAIFPFSILFMIFVISGGEAVHFAIAGGMVMALARYGLILCNELVYYKLEYRIKDMCIASPVSSFSFMAGLAVSELLFGLPALVILGGSIAYLAGGLALGSVLLLIAVIILIWGSMAAMGFFVASQVSHTRKAEQITTALITGLGVLPPVFYPMDLVPAGLQWLAYLAPTTHASLVFQHVMGLATPQGWSVGVGFAVMAAFMMGSLLLARTKSVWREA
jgi:ABC-2 type transport system permease protein